MAQIQGPTVILALWLAAGAIASSCSLAGVSGDGRETLASLTESVGLPTVTRISMAGVDERDFVTVSSPSEDAAIL